MIVYIAEYFTDKYGNFMAADIDRDRALASLIEGLKFHVREYDLSDDWIDLDNIPLHHVPRNEVLRDTEPMGLGAAWS